MVPCALQPTSPPVSLIQLENFRINWPVTRLQQTTFWVWDQVEIVTAEIFRLFINLFDGLGGYLIVFWCFYYFNICFEGFGSGRGWDFDKFE